MKATAIIQARMGSTRLPGKVLLEIQGKSILEYVLSRVAMARHVDTVIVATTVSKNDLEIVNKASQLGTSVYCGDEEDVLDRYYQAAKLFKCQDIIRITSDCPLIDPRVIDQVIERYFAKEADYCSNTLVETFPDGQDVEVMSFKTLENAWRHAALASEREHVTPYVRNHPELFCLENVACSTDLGDKRWTLDQKEDFAFLTPVLEHFSPDNLSFSMQDVLGFLDTRPDLEQLNNSITRNEGYILSQTKGTKLS